MISFAAICHFTLSSNVSDFKTKLKTLSIFFKSSGFTQNKYSGLIYSKANHFSVRTLSTQSFCIF
jgi:hypothetical protein